MADELEEFLGAPEEEVAAAVETPAPEPAAAVAVEPSEKAAAPPGDPAPAEDPEPADEDLNGLKSALQKTRRERSDHKGRADRLDGELAAMRAEVEALRVQRQQSPMLPAASLDPGEQPYIPNPLEDPQGYHEYNERQRFNDRLNNSENLLRTYTDHADVDASLAVFRKAADNSEQLRKELVRQADPYRWAYLQGKRLQAAEEIGPDPAAYRARVAEEIRAQVLAELASGDAAPPPAAPRVTLPHSLGTARSAGTRSMPVINIPESFDDILAAPRRR